MVKNRIATGVAAFGLMCTMGLGSIANAQDNTVHHGFLHRHPKVATAGAGYLAYKAAKHSHHGVFHRHPFATGLAAAAVTHHYAHKHQ